MGNCRDIRGGGMSYEKNQRDLNEREIISTLVAAGAYVQQMDRHAGFDLLVCHAGVVYVAEVKAPGGRFTQAEMDTEAAITATGCKYWVLRDFMDALRMIGATTAVMPIAPP